MSAWPGCGALSTHDGKLALLVAVNTLLERFALSLTPARRVLLAVYCAMPFFIVFVGTFVWALLTPEVRSGLHVPTMWGLVASMVLATMVLSGVVLSLWPARHLPDPVPKATLVACLCIGPAFTLLTLATGMFTAGLNLVLLAVLMVGLLLFERSPMWLAYITCVIMLMLHDMGVLLGLFAYAPALLPQAWEHGQPVWWFAYWRGFVLVTAYVVPLALLLFLFDRLDALHFQLSRLSNTDGLTGLANRRCFMEALQNDIARQSRTGEPLCLILVDADHFKQVNDVHGHDMGDRVLQTLARLMLTQTRVPTDVACRIGGEEFALILPDTRLEDATRIAERLRQQCNEQRFEGEGGAFSVTVSMGVAEGLGKGADVLLRCADQQLYRAKSGGRDRVCTPPSDEALA